MSEKTEKKKKEQIHSNRIRAILEEKKMSQIELADKALNGDSAHLNRIINGHRRSVSLPIAIKIARVLGKPVEEVFIYQNEDEGEKKA